ncbi:unnamed protein product [Phyllotreta striolata]|uniref:Serine/threonine-protein phosphatase 4 regulatory subunit 4 n=1 Tax=Phyllotreta striolata TaxID=444603 RepID=A0A9N9XJ17_PHYSR|nr:unnamed protein product [Phyllotreta striolata]
MSKKLIDEEFESLQLDRPGSGKTPLQIQKHSIDPSFENKPIERSLYILSKGDVVQKLSVIQNLPNLLNDDYNGTLTRIIPKIQQELPMTSSIEFHLITSKIYKVLIEMKLDINLLKIVLQGIESKDPIVAGAWNETLVETITFLSEAAVKNEVLPFAIKQSQLNKPVTARVNSCRMIGKIAIHPQVSTFDVKKEIVPVTQSLCQDCLYEVRAAMCSELCNVAKGLANEKNVEASLLTCLVELSNDENVQVRAAAVNVAVALIPYLSQEAVNTAAVPLVKRLCLNSLSEGDMTFADVAKNYGKMLTFLQHHLNEEDGLWFINQFVELSRKGLVLVHEDFESEPLSINCRVHCAANLANVAFFVLSVVPNEKDKLYHAFEELAADPCFIVRKTVAENIFEITKALGAGSQVIIPDILKLIRDDSEEVLDVLIPNIGNTFTFLANAGFLSKEQTTQTTIDMGRALVKCQTEIFKYHNWRRKRSFLEQLEKLPNCTPSDFIHQHFTPLILKLTIEGARPVRTQAARTLLFFLKHNVKDNHRKWIKESLISTLCNSESCYNRHIFVNMCHEAIQVFSWKYFKESFYIPLLSLGEDPVSTVRLTVANMFPLLKKMLMMPLDRQLQTKLDHVVTKLEANEKDKDVLAILKANSKIMKNPQLTKPEELLEEKRKVEEEDKVHLGKATSSLAPMTSRNRNISSAVVRDSKNQRSNSRGQSKSSLSTNLMQMNRASSTPSGTFINEMNFLDQHFYTDAGVALPESASSTSIRSLEDDLSLLSVQRSQFINDEVSTISVENTNIENMSDDDLIELKTYTTNITDDVKVDLEKKTGNSISKGFEEHVRKRNKRNSCFFANDNTQRNKSVLKRRSLNLTVNETSRIPVIIRKNKIGIESSKLKITPVEYEENNDKPQNTMCNKNGNIKSSFSNSYKKKVTITSDKNFTKASNLPVLIRGPPQKDGQSGQVTSQTRLQKSNFTS